MGKLYVVGTPIGNLGDLSPRAQRTLEECDFIAAEDTRVTIKLLTHFGIKKPMVSYHEHNMRQRGEEILSRITAGETCAIVTDAGMPCISDPGEMLVAQCRDAHIPVEVVPGPSALIAALAVSGLITSRFAFEGFLSMGKSSRAQRLAELKTDPRTLIFYEAPHKLLATLKDMLEALGDRRITLARELTKLHEEVRRTTLSEAVQWYEANPARGEFVLLLEGAPRLAEVPSDFGDATEQVRTLAESGLSLSDAAREVAQMTGHKKGDLYKAALGKGNQSLAEIPLKK